MDFKVRTLHDNRFSEVIKYGFESPPFTIVITTEGLKPAEQQKVDAAAKHWEAAFNSPEFEHYILSYPRSFTYASGRSHQQVYDIIMSGRETLGNGQLDHIAQVFLKIDRSYRKKVIGYTFANTRWQWIYSWAFKSFSVQEVAANLAHEYCHKLGFGDSKAKYSYDAVTYATGRYVESFKNTPASIAV